jgi:hypothetical protein
VELKLTFAPVAPAGNVSMTVHVEEPAEIRRPGEQLKLLTIGCRATASVAPTPVIGTASPEGDTPITPVTDIELPSAPGASLTTTFASGPSGMPPAFSPYDTQVYAAATTEQLSDFPASVRAGEAVTWKPAISAAE